MSNVERLKSAYKRKITKKEVCKNQASEIKFKQFARCPTFSYAVGISG